MKKRTMAAVCVLAGLILATILIPTGNAISQSLQEVIVTNWPDIWTVRGGVSIQGPVHMSAMASKRDMIVAPVKPQNTTRIYDAGIIDTEGFSHVTLSLVGLTKGSPNNPGMVGAILVPDQETIINAFNEEGMYLFDMEVSASGVSSASPYFASNQPKYQVGFSRYRVFVYNTTDKTVEADLYAYLTN